VTIALRRLAAAVGLTLLGSAAGAASGVGINVGEAGGPYHAALCPPIAAALARSRLAYSCTPSRGPRETLQRIAADPRQLGLVPLATLATEAASLGGVKAFTRVRAGDARECLLAVTRHPDVASTDDLAANAGKLRFLVAAKGSGGAAQLALLQQIDPGGLGRAKSVLHAETSREAVKLALSAADTVAMLSLVPSPRDPLLELIAAQGGHVVPVVSRDILRHQVEGQKLYFAEEFEAVPTRWLKAGAKAVTACTPTVLVTGASERIADEKARQDHKDMIATLQALKREQVVERPGLMRRIVHKSRELSAAGAERVRSLIARTRAGSAPYVDKAREATAKAAEATRPAVEKARERTAEALARAQQQAKELIDGAKPADPPKQP
jgi:hypothetical protein